MIIASIDPGKLTGLVVVQTVKHKILEVDTVLNPAELIFRVERGEFELTIVESPPFNVHPNENYVQPYLDIHFANASLNIVFIGPSTWKPYMTAQNVYYPKACTTQHEKDAFSMLAYWMDRQVHDWKDYVS